MIFTRDGQGAADSRRWVTGKIFGLQIPADVEALLSSGTDFLTRAGLTLGQSRSRNVFLTCYVLTTSMSTPPR